VRGARAKVKGERGGAIVNQDRVRLVALTVAFMAMALAIGAPTLDAPGVYYDEVIQAEPALWFLRAEAAPPEVPGARHVEVLGRPLPWMTQPYMGALKSQVLIPVLAWTGPDTRWLRTATLGIALAGFCLAMAFTARCFDPPTAVLFGLLLASDPSFLFTSRHDWGSFALGFTLRCAAALALLGGWRARSAGRLFAGGLCAGLAVYNKIDAAVPIAAALAAALVAVPHLARDVASRARALGAALAGALLGAAPLLAQMGAALHLTQVAARRSAGGSGDWSEKWTAFAAVLDGTYFQRLMRAGGSFDALAGVEDVVATPFPLLFAGCALGLAVWLVREWRAGRRHPGPTFALLAALLTFAGIFATPRAVRIHHFLNAWPLPQLVVAVAVREGWRHMRHPVARGALALALLAAYVGAARADFATRDVMSDTGGKGLWSDAVVRLVPELAGSRVVALDWGFAIPLRWTDPSLRVDEPIWRLRGRPRARRELEGDAKSVYLLHERPYAVFPFGPALLDALAALPSEAYALERHLDRGGDTAFVSLRFAGPHRLVYRGGRFEVQFP
jgi:hypothetical protein